MTFQEDNIFRKIDRDREKRKDLSPAMKEMHSYIEQQVFTNPKYSIDPREFKDLYGEENLAADQREVEMLEREFARDTSEFNRHTKEISLVLEGLVLLNANNHGWFGDNVTVLRTARIDDLRGTDMVAEFLSELESRVIGLSIDTTFGPGSIDRKFEKHYKNIDKNQGGTIKYFRTADGSFRGERKVPQVVVGISQNVVEELAHLAKTGNKSALMSHPIQRVILEQMYAQLEGGYRYASEREQTAVAGIYAQALSIIDELRKQKRGIPMGALANDPVHLAIMEATKKYSSGKAFSQTPHHS